MLLKVAREKTESPANILIYWLIFLVKRIVYVNKTNTDSDNIMPHKEEPVTI